MTDFGLIFDGLAWPAARITGWADKIVFSDPVWTPRPPRMATCRTTGSGRAWSATGPAAFWINFAMKDWGTEAAAPDIEDFLRRRGDPTSALTPKNPVLTALWSDIAIALRPAAEAWATKPDNNGIYHVLDPDKLASARKFTSKLAALTPEDRFRHTEVDVDPAGGFAIRAKTLEGFMSLSADLLLKREAPLKRCTHCGDFFPFQRSTASTCSSACRNAQSKANREGAN